MILTSPRETPGSPQIQQASPSTPRHATSQRPHRKGCSDSGIGPTQAAISLTRVNPMHPTKLYEVIPAVAMHTAIASHRPAANVAGSMRGQLMASPCPNADGSSPQRRGLDAAPDMCIDPAKHYTATMTTTLGEMVIALDAAASPKTVNNFVTLARHHFYDGVVFHRIINGFMCQGGDPTGTGRGGPGYRFADELPAPGRYEIGSLAMANAGPDTNGSQFFIVSGADGVGLPPQYSLFGKVVAGLEVVDEMQRVETDRSDRPTTDVVIESVTIAEAG